MPDFKQSLLGHDLGHLRIIAEHWGLHLEAADSQAGSADLNRLVLNQELVSEVIAALPAQAIAALKTLQDSQGKIPWAQFIRQYGEVREMGPGRRDRERPDRTPISTTEIVWYRGLIGRAFFDTSRGTTEFAYVPNDLLSLFPSLTAEANQNIPTDQEDIKVMGRAATHSERSLVSTRSDRIVDHVCTILAGLRMGLRPDSLESHIRPYPCEFTYKIGHLAGLIDSDGTPSLEKTKTFLELGRGEALSQLAQAWLNSAEHNDLRHIPNLQAEGEWSNDPLGTRGFILKLISVLPPNKWWSLSAFIADIKAYYPDFQRPAGDYDSWYLQDSASGKFLRGFNHWDEVDGALIRYLINGPMRWLGMVDLATPEDEPAVTAFKLSDWGLQLLAGQILSGFQAEDEPVHVRSNGQINIPNLVPRVVRYQLARFCKWEEKKSHEYRYRLTPSSLSKAQDTGLSVRHLLSLLRKHSENIPPNIITALDRWDKNGAQVRVQEAVILRLGSPKILEKLRRSRASRFLETPLGPATIMVKPGAEEKVLAMLTEMGYLGELIRLVDPAKD